MTHFTSIADCSSEELRHLLDVATQLKKQHKTTGKITRFSPAKRWR